MAQISPQESQYKKVEREFKKAYKWLDNPLINLLMVFLAIVALFTKTWYLVFSFLGVNILIGFVRALYVFAHSPNKKIHSLSLQRAIMALVFIILCAVGIWISLNMQ